MLPVVTSALNEAPLERLGRRADGTPRSPLEVMTGIEPRRAILRVLPQNVDAINAKTIKLARATQVININGLQDSIERMHKDVERLVTIRRERAIANHNKATNILTASFVVGDYVLVRRARDRGHKLRFMWFGPCQVTGVLSPLVYDIKSFATGKTERVHCARLLKYDDSLLGQDVPQDVLDLADRTETRYEVAERIVDVGEAPDGRFFEIEWEGLPDKSDWTWVPVAELYEDIPTKVTEFLSAAKKKKKLVREVQLQLGISV